MARSGPAPVLTKDEEEYLVECVLPMNRCYHTIEL